jgi:hypothetical protein
MKITKNAAKVTASKNIPSANDDAKRYIKCAIDALGKSAVSGDKFAKSAIADLSVILLGMK